LIEACRLLRDRGREFQCVIVGGGPLEAELRAQIEAGGLSQCVQLPGPRSQRQVRELLATAEMFVLPCVPEAGGGSDNLPTVIMEAMAAGVPVISTPLAGVPEMITDGIDGLLVPVRAPAQLADAIVKLLDAPELGQKLGAAGQASAREKFAIERTTTALKDLLKAKARVKDPTQPQTRLERLEQWLRGLRS
jgi:glycosyltransferase involved in cell wall biosynthesis